MFEKYSQYSIRLLSVFIFATGILSVAPVFSQDIPDDYETLLLAEEDEEQAFSAFKPVLGIGRGIVTNFGDVKDFYFKPLYGRPATSAFIARNINKFLDFELFVTFGKMAGNQYLLEQNLNFETDIFTGGVGLTYNFYHLLKRKRPVSPYISLGVETFQFSPKGDLKDAFNRTYLYGPDGTIRDMDNPSVIITRDFKYETDLRDYTGGNYSLMTFGIPFDFGINIIVADRMTMRIGNAFHFTFSDYVDGKKSGSGFFANDKFLYTYASLRLDLFSPAEEIVAVETFKNLKFTITDNVDTDQDGVDDFNDECPDSPLGVEVDYKGCPVDEDHDGVPDYLDKQPDTPGGSVAISPSGIRIIDTHLISMLYDPDAVDRKELMNYYKGTENVKAREQKVEHTEIPTKFKFLDLNEDNYISIEELQKAIDGLFDFSSPLTVEDIYELQEFFFEQ